VDLLTMAFNRKLPWGSYMQYELQNPSSHEARKTTIKPSLDDGLAGSLGINSETP
jgi:hypothetical protein